MKRSRDSILKGKKNLFVFVTITAALAGVFCFARLLEYRDPLPASAEVSAAAITTDLNPRFALVKDTFFTHTIPASGGTAPYTFQFVITPPPDGMTLNLNTGVFSGTPTTSGVSGSLLNIADSGVDSVNTPVQFVVSSYPTAPTTLYVNSTNAQAGTANPTGIDATPVFSAICNDPDAGDVLSKYRIQVDNNNDFSSVLWDSGSSGTTMTDCTEGQRSQDIAYGGSALTLDGTTYYWRIKFWNVFTGAPYTPDANYEGSFSSGADTFTVTSSNTAPTAPTTLFSNNDTAQTGSVNPANLTDTTPAFSAVYTDGDVGDIANKYRVQVANNALISPVLWDSGSSGTNMANCARNARCADINFGGTALQLNGATYYWRIKYWDQTGAEGAWSESTPVSANFIMASPGGSAPQRQAEMQQQQEPLAETPEEEPTQQEMLPPAPPVAPFFAPRLGQPQPLSSTSIQWPFVDVNDNETGFQLLDSDGNVRATAQANAVIILETGLRPNTMYRRRLVAINEGGASPSSEASSVYTYAQVPAGLEVLSVTAGQATVQVRNVVEGELAATVAEPSSVLQGYPGDTAYLFENQTTGETSGWIRSRQYTFTGLAASTPYDVRVRTRNADGIETAATVPQRIRTVAADAPQLELSMSVQVQSPTPGLALTAGFPAFVSKLLTALLGAGLLFVLFKLAAIHRFNTRRFHHTFFSLIHSAERAFARLSPQAAQEDNAGFTEFSRHHAHLQGGFISFLGLLAMKAIATSAVALLSFSTAVLAEPGVNDHGRGVTLTDRLVYRIDYAHRGGGAATGVVITSPVDPYFDYFDIGSGSLERDTLRYVLGTVEPGSSGVLFYTVGLAGNTPQPSLIMVNASLNASELAQPIVSNTVVNSLGASLVLQEATPAPLPDDAPETAPDPDAAPEVAPEPEVEPTPDQPVSEPTEAQPDAPNDDQSQTQPDPGQATPTGPIQPPDAPATQPISAPAPATAEPTYTTDVSTDGRSFMLSVISENEGASAAPPADTLVVTGRAEDRDGQLVISGTTDEPSTFLTIIFDNNATVNAISDEAGQWSAAITHQDLGISEGEAREVSIDAIASNSGRQSRRVNVANIMVGQTEVTTPTLVWSEQPAVVLQQAVKQAVSTVVKTVQEQETAIETTLSVAAPVAVASSAPLWGYLPYLPTLLYHGLTSLVGAAGRRRRRTRRYYGIVYDSITKTPIPLAIVRAYDKVTDKLVATQVSDKQGRYDFLLNQGRYRLEVAKPQYQFPSRIVTQPLDGDYQHVYREESGMVMPDNETSTAAAVLAIPDVPLDPVNVEEQRSLASGLKRAWLVFQHAGQYLAFPVLAVGMVISLVVALTVPENYINWLVVAFYLVFFSLQWTLRPAKERAWGVIYDQLSNAALPLATVQLIDPSYSKIVKSRLSDYQGRFSFLPDPGTYVIKASKAGYTQVWPPQVVPDRQPLPSEVEIKKADQRIVGDIAMVHEHET